MYEVSTDTSQRLVKLINFVHEHEGVSKCMTARVVVFRKS